MDLVTMARTAREGFARGLGALQTPDVPPPIGAAAEPIAQAMSALHRIESSRGAELAQAGPSALIAARQALSQLQSIPSQHPAVLQAIEAIAGSLGLVHQISQQAGQASVAPIPPTRPSSAYGPGAVEQPPQVAVVQPGWSGQQQPQPANPIAQTQLASTPWQNPSAQAPQGYPPPEQQAYQPPPQAAQQAGLAATQASSALHVEAELGAHSTTNFSKGLSGNDVVDSGGIFIATYSIPEIGTPLLVKVSLPGGYEFEAQAIVRWTRDSPLSGADGSPGFGAQFTQISPEARQLVYRYVRNREPLFHDDL